MLNLEFIEFDEAIAIHDDLIESYGGSFGLRDKGLLESALAQPKASFFNKLLHPTLADQAAAYVYHIAQNHAFFDGNKRTAIAVAESFLALNGYILTLLDEEEYDLTCKAAQGQISKQEIAVFIQSRIYAF